MKKSEKHLEKEQTNQLLTTQKDIIKDIKEIKKGMLKNQETNRRDFIKGLSVGLLGGIPGVFYFVEKIFNNAWSFESKILKDPTGNHLNKIINTDHIKIFAGKTNLLRAHSGKFGISGYMKNISESFEAYLKNITGVKNTRTLMPNDPLLLFNEDDKDLVLFGGPVTNPLTAKLTGYKYEKVLYENKEIEFPRFISNEIFRFGFYCGEQSYGVFNNKNEKVFRYEDKEKIERPRYGIIDNGIVRFFEINSNGFQTEECLIITKVYDYSNQRNILSIAGMHGYSSEAFANDIDTNLLKLSELAKGNNNFQIIVPVHLDHFHESKQTKGILNWDKSEFVSI